MHRTLYPKISCAGLSFHEGMAETADCTSCLNTGVTAPGDVTEERVATEDTGEERSVHARARVGLVSERTIMDSDHSSWNTDSLTI